MRWSYEILAGRIHGRSVRSASGIQQTSWAWELLSLTELTRFAASVEFQTIHLQIPLSTELKTVSREVFGDRLVLDPAAYTADQMNMRIADRLVVSRPAIEGEFAHVPHFLEDLQVSIDCSQTQAGKAVLDQPMDLLSRQVQPIRSQETSDRFTLSRVSVGGRDHLTCVV